MLVFSRKKEQNVIITVAGKKITIKVIDIGLNSIKLGFEADRDVIIHREEVQEQVDAESHKQVTAGEGQVKPYQSKD
jgi:carbon storage regulator CsrA